MFWKSDRPGQKKRMITLYKGSRGKGKTLTMVKDAYKYFLAGYKVLANFKLNFGEYISPEETLVLNRYSMMENCVLVLDEIQLFFDSRNFQKQENKDFSNFLQQIRKRNIKILCTAQYTNTIDLRLRQQIDMVAYPHYNRKTKICKVDYFNLTVIEDNVNLKALRPFTVFFDALPIFKLYNTHEILG